MHIKLIKNEIFYQQNVKLKDVMSILFLSTMEVL